MGGVDGVVDWWIQPEFRLEAEERWRSRFLVHVLLLGIGLSVAMATIYAVMWVPLLLLQCATVGLALLVSLVSFRVGGTFRFSSTLALVSVTVAFVVPPLLEREFDPAGLAWFSVLPFVAALLLGRRMAYLWLGICMVLMVGLYLHPLAWGIISLTPHVTLARSLLLMVAILVFALSFESRQREVRQELQQANRAKSSFLANMSHELRTPMNGVLGLTEVLLLKADLASDVQEQLRLVQHSGRAMVSLVNDILDLSKVEAGKLTIEQADFSLAVLLRDLAGLYQPVAQQKGLRWAVEQGPGVPDHVRGDSLRLRQVLGNLVDNALKFTEQGGVTLRVGVETDGRVRLCVSDSGPGISAEVAARLFTPFEQADKSTTRRYGGSGLGLALSSQLVGLMGGRLELERGAEQGATFAFSVPLPRAAVPSPEVPPAALPGRVGAGRVLVVDDNPINLRVACALVAAEGAQVCSAVDGKTALELVRQQAFDLVLMDCHMPVMDGLEATRAIRQLPGPRLAIVALTASALPEERQAAFAAGVDDFLTKPLNPKQLRQVMSRWLSAAPTR